MPKLTQAEADALLTAAGFLLSGEWDETITAKEHAALRRAVEKLEAMKQACAARGAVSETRAAR